MEGSALKKFYQEVQAKVDSKDRKHLSEEAYLIKSMKFFDVFNQGVLSYEQFIKSIEKLGLYYPYDRLLPICKHFDLHNRGSIDYVAFAKEIYQPVWVHSDISSISKTIAEEIKEDPMNLFQYLKERLVNRGAGSIIGLKRVCQTMDQSGLGTISLDSFIMVIKDLRIDLSNDQIVLLFTLFDDNNDGFINYYDFIKALQGQMTRKRFEIVSNTFDYLIKQYPSEVEGYIDINQLLENYDARKHPSVIAGKISSKEAMNDFATSIWDQHASIVGTSGINLISKNEFIDYYTIVSTTVTMDTDFELILNNWWNILAETPKSHYERNWTNKRGEGRTFEEEIIFRKLYPDNEPTLKTGLESRSNPWQTVNTYYQNIK